MGMFDSVRVLNVSHGSFSHNDVEFQTKSLDLDMSEYWVFNSKLYKQYDGETSSYLTDAEAIDYTGELNIYTRLTDEETVRWIEYNLLFENGQLQDVELVENEIREDFRDISQYRPKKPNDRVEVTINIQNLSTERKEAFSADIEKKLEVIRTALSEPTATIFYPVNTQGSNRNPLITMPRFISRASVVQTLADIENANLGNDRALQVDAPNGDTIVVLDEAHQFMKAQFQKH